MKIAIVGGGSYCWTPTLVRDVLFTPGLEGAEIVLEDVNKKHLTDLYKCGKAILAQTGKEKQFTLRATMDEAEALRGADYVILTITTGGYDAMENDLRIPYKYGVYQPVGDTVGPGGLSRALRNIPVVAGLAKQMERRCPKAWLLNITNPMTVLTRAVGKTTGVRCIGLCHELYGTLRQLQKMLGAEDWRRDFDCVTVGVNHLPWIIRLRYKGKDAFPLIEKLGRQMAGASKGDAGTALDSTLEGKNQAKFALFNLFGALPAAGDRHVVEFFPWFTTKEMGKGAGVGVKLTTIEDRRFKYTPSWKKHVADITSGKVKMSTDVSAEATAPVIAALAGLRDWQDVVNIPNDGQIMELPRDVVVETMGLIKRDQVRGLPVGPVPAPILAQIQRHVTVQEMTVEAALTGDRKLALQALLLDPMSSIVRDYRNVEKMLDELLQANRRWLPQFFPK